MDQILQQQITPSILDQMPSLTTSTLPQNQKLLCRICFDQMAKTQIFQTCRCKGSNLPIHKRCLLQWIQRSHAIRSFMGHPYFQCEICRDTIFLELKNRRRIVTIRQMRQKLCDKSICNEFMVAVIFHVLLFVIGMVYFVLFEREMGECAVMYMAVFSVTFALSMVGVFVYKSVVSEETVSIGLEEGRVWKVGLLKKISEFIKEHIEMDSRGSIVQRK